MVTLPPESANRAWEWGENSPGIASKKRQFAGLPGAAEIKAAGLKRPHSFNGEPQA